MQLSFAEMFYEQKLDVRDNDVTSRRDYIKTSLFRLYIAYFEGQECQITPTCHMRLREVVLVDDVTGHVDYLKSSLFRCILLIRKQKVPNYYNMSYETQRCSLFDDVTSQRD